MKKINQYLPFLIWSFATIILTILAFILLPVLILWKKAESYFRGKVAEGNQNAEEQPDSNSVFVM